MELDDDDGDDEDLDSITDPLELAASVGIIHNCASLLSLRSAIVVPRRLRDWGFDVPIQTYPASFLNSFSCFNVFSQSAKRPARSSPPLTLRDTWKANPSSRSATRTESPNTRTSSSSPPALSKPSPVVGR